MVVLGIILALIGYFTAISVLLYLGVALIVIGLVLWVAPQPFQGGRRWY